MAKAIDVRVELGKVGDKTYYWNRTTDSLEWSVPDPRSAIVALPGYVILAADYSQIEVKIMAYASGDATLIAAINSGLDVHTFNAVEVFGGIFHFTYEEMEEARSDASHPRFLELSTIRSRIKTVTFGVPYGAGPARVALMTGMSIEESEAFIDAFFKKFHVLKRWLDRQGLLAVELGYSTSPRGRKRYYEIPNPDDPDAQQLLAQIKRWAGNMPIQAGNADILKVAMGRIYRELRGGSVIAPRIYDAWIILVVHDEIVLMCNVRDAAAVKKIMARCMNDAYHEIVPRRGEPGWIALGPEKDDWGVHVVSALVWAKA